MDDIALNGIREPGPSAAALLQPTGTAVVREGQVTRISIKHPHLACAVPRCARWGGVPHETIQHSCAGFWTSNNHLPGGPDSHSVSRLETSQNLREPHKSGCGANRFWQTRDL